MFDVGVTRKIIRYVSLLDDFGIRAWWPTTALDFNAWNDNPIFISGVSFCIEQNTIINNSQQWFNWLSICKQCFVVAQEKYMYLRLYNYLRMLPILFSLCRSCMRTNEVKRLISFFLLNQVNATFINESVLDFSTHKKLSTDKVKKVWPDQYMLIVWLNSSKTVFHHLEKWDSTNNLPDFNI